MSVQFIAQGASMQLFALTQDEKSARHHHYTHGDGQKQNQSGAKAHAVAPSLKRRLDGRSIAARFHDIEQVGQQISRHTSVPSSSFLSGRVRAVRDQCFDSFGFIDALYLPRAAAQDQIMLPRIVLTTVDKLHAQVRACSKNAPAFPRPAPTRLARKTKMALKLALLFKATSKKGIETARNTRK
jgi:hypothetical protein